MLVVRHGRAGERDEWHGDDAARPLDEKGRKQAEALVDLLGGYRVERILSSPAVRCAATVEPLAQARGLEVETREELGEERQLHDGSALLRSLAGMDVVICGHGGLEQAALADPPRGQKGAVLVLDDALRVVDTLRT
jgi:phosphohistidine phosphatase SixA